MPRSRKNQIALEATPYYHYTSRCVRRAFLCDRDEYTGNDYEHRRDWIEKRMLTWAKVYALDICAYAVMSNHYHVVLHINTEKANAWSDTKVIQRWQALYAGNFLSQEYLAGKDLYEEQISVISELVKEWRERLMSISSFMRALNEDIARQANATVMAVLLVRRYYQSTINLSHSDVLLPITSIGFLTPYYYAYPNCPAK